MPDAGEIEVLIAAVDAGAEPDLLDERLTTLAGTRGPITTHAFRRWRDTPRGQLPAKLNLTRLRCSGVGRGAGAS